MDAFASVADLEARWRKLDDSERARAEVLLGDATVKIALEMRASGTDPAAVDDVRREAMRATCCSMVRRAMVTPADMVGVSSFSQGANGFTETTSWQNPNGDLYLSASERDELGIGLCSIGSLLPRMRGRDA